MQFMGGLHKLRHDPEPTMTTREQIQNQLQEPYSALTIANHPARLAEFVSTIQDAIAQQSDNPEAQERLCRHLCNINSHRIMITHVMQIRNMQINSHRKLAYKLKKLIQQKGTVACSAYSSSCNYPEKACHMEMLQMHLKYIEEIKTAAYSNIYPIINYIADVVSEALAELATLHDIALVPDAPPYGLPCI